MIERTRKPWSAAPLEDRETWRAHRQGQRLCQRSLVSNTWRETFWKKRVLAGKTDERTNKEFKMKRARTSGLKKQRWRVCRRKRVLLLGGWTCSRTINRQQIHCINQWIFIVVCNHWLLTVDYCSACRLDDMIGDHWSEVNRLPGPQEQSESEVKAKCGSSEGQTRTQWGYDAGLRGE